MLQCLFCSVMNVRPEFIEENTFPVFRLYWLLVSISQGLPSTSPLCWVTKTWISSNFSGWFTTWEAATRWGGGGRANTWKGLIRRIYILGGVGGANKVSSSVRDGAKEGFAGWTEHLTIFLAVCHNPMGFPVLSVDNVCGSVSDRVGHGVETGLHGSGDPHTELCCVLQR